MIYKLDIYECNSQNFKKGGALSKRAKTAQGSFMDVQPDDAERVETPLVVKHLEKYGYTNIHTGYVDNILYLKRGDKDYVAFQSIDV